MPPIKRKRRNNNKETRIEKSTLGILHLNNDCLLEIFTYLSPLDMCAVKDTCRRFSSLAKSHMELYYKSKVFVISDRVRAQDDNIHCQMKEFYKFCSILTNLDISVPYINYHDKNVGSVLSTIRKCNPQLNSLALTDTNFDMALSRLQKTFPQLRKIKLEYFDAKAFRYDIRREDIIKDIYKACKNVEEISFGARLSSMGCQFQGIFLQQKFKKLRSLELYEVRDIDINSLKLCLKLNPNLKTITLKNCVRLGELSAIDFVKCSPDIEGISLSFNTLDHTTFANTPLYQASELCELKQLKLLALDTCSTMVTDFIKSLAEKDSLHFLCLTNVRAKLNEGLATAFCNMKNLKILRLHIIVYSVNTSEFKDFYKILAINLVHLIELHLIKTVVFFQQICDIIENFVNLKKLYLPRITREWNEDNFLVLVETRLRKNAVVPLNIILDFESSAVELFLIPKHVLNENNHIIKLAFDINYNDYLLPNSI